MAARGDVGGLRGGRAATLRERARPVAASAVKKVRSAVDAARASAPAAKVSAKRAAAAKLSASKSAAPAPSKAAATTVPATARAAASGSPAKSPAVAEARAGARNGGTAAKAPAAAKAAAAKAPAAGKAAVAKPPAAKATAARKTAPAGKSAPGVEATSNRKAAPAAKALPAAGETPVEKVRPVGDKPVGGGRTRRSTQVAAEHVGAKVATGLDPDHRPARGTAVPAATAVVDGRPGELAAIRAILEQDVVDLRHQLEDVTHAIDEVREAGADSTGDDQADAGSATFEREQGMSLAANHRDMLEQTEHALSRMDDGTYGACENCGRPIGVERLQAFPRATLCKECKQRSERR